MQRCAWIGLVLLAGCGPPASAPADAVDELLELMQQRLLLMHDVARWKWNEQRPIADPEREQALLTDLGAQARQRDVDPLFARRFFRAQIEAAKLIQEADHERWRSEKQGRFAEAADLASQLRPRIDALNGQLLQALKRSAAERHRILQRAAAVLNGDGITEAVRRAALAPFAEELRP